MMSEIRKIDFNLLPSHPGQKSFPRMTRAKRMKITTSLWIIKNYTKRRRKKKRYNENYVLLLVFISEVSTSQTEFLFLVQEKSGTLMTFPWNA